MGQYSFDQYSLLHVATGVIAYFWGLSFAEWMILHLIYEIIDNTNWFIYLVNNWIFFWPGGKLGKDSLENSIGDTIGSALGWFIAMGIDSLGTQYGLYPRHLEHKTLWSVRPFIQ